MRFEKKSINYIILEIELLLLAAGAVWLLCAPVRSFSAEEICPHGDSVSASFSALAPGEYEITVNYANYGAESVLCRLETDKSYFHHIVSEELLLTPEAEEITGVFYLKDSASFLRLRAEQTEDLYLDTVLLTRTKGAEKAALLTLFLCLAAADFLLFGFQYTKSHPVSGTDAAKIFLILLSVCMASLPAFTDYMTAEDFLYRITAAGRRLTGLPAPMVYDVCVVGINLLVALVSYLVFWGIFRKTTVGVTGSLLCLLSPLRLQALYGFREEHSALALENLHFLLENIFRELVLVSGIFVFFLLLCSRKIHARRSRICLVLVSGAAGLLAFFLGTHGIALPLLSLIWCIVIDLVLSSENRSKEKSILIGVLYLAELLLSFYQINAMMLTGFHILNWYG